MIVHITYQLKLREKMRKILIRLTYKIWHSQLNKVLSVAYERGIIDSRQWHSLAAMFDRTQPKHYLMETTF